MESGSKRARGAQEGFTIVELLIVIIVITILAAVTLVAYTSVSAGATDSVVKSDLKANLDRIDLFNAKNGRIPSSNDISSGDPADDYKLKVSKRSAYAFLGYCTGKLNGETEIIMTAGTSNGHQFYISSADSERLLKDVSSDFNLPSNNWGSYKCIDYLRPGSSPGENRDMIHRDGGVEGGYVTILAQ